MGDTHVIIEKDVENEATTAASPDEENPDQDWLEDIRVEKEVVTVAKQVSNGTVEIEEAWIQIDTTDETK